MISGALEIILLQPSSMIVYLNTQMRNRGAVLGPVSFQLDDCKIREIIALLDKCQEGYLKEAGPRTAKKNSLRLAFICLWYGKCCPVSGT